MTLDSSAFDRVTVYYTICPSSDLSNESTDMSNSLFRAVIPVEPGGVGEIDTV